MGIFKALRNKAALALISDAPTAGACGAAAAKKSSRKVPRYQSVVARSCSRRPGLARGVRRSRSWDRPGRTGPSRVTFNSVSATFTAVSGSEITATVPTGPTKGEIQVVPPGATLSSNVA